MNVDKTLYCRDRDEWRNWLEQHHNIAEEAWLIHFKKQSGKTSVSHDEAVEEALCFGWIDGKLKSIDDDKYALRYSPRKAKSVWSKINREKAEMLIAHNRMTASGLAAIEEAKRNGNWDAAYTSKTKSDIPLDLKRALMKDAKAFANFKGFANTYQNMYIGWVVGAKTEETRKNRIVEVVKMSALNKKAGIE